MGHLGFRIRRRLSPRADSAVLKHSRRGTQGAARRRDEPITTAARISQAAFGQDSRQPGRRRPQAALGCAPPPSTGRPGARVPCAIRGAPTPAPRSGPTRRAQSAPGRCGAEGRDRSRSSDAACSSRGPARSDLCPNHPRRFLATSLLMASAR